MKHILLSRSLISICMVGYCFGMDQQTSDNPGTAFIKHTIAIFEETIKNFETKLSQDPNFLDTPTDEWKTVLLPQSQELKVLDKQLLDDLSPQAQKALEKIENTIPYKIKSSQLTRTNIISKFKELKTALIKEIAETLATFYTIDIHALALD